MSFMPFFLLAQGLSPWNDLVEHGLTQTSLPPAFRTSIGAAPNVYLPLITSKKLTVQQPEAS